jgi:hypothetical protein
MGQANENLVTDCVAELVIDCFETIEVHKRHGKSLASPLTLQH